MQNGELKQILAAASRIRGRSQALVVVGIGGSYLGAKGAVELLRPWPQPGDPKLLFAGNSLSPDALMHLLEELGDLDFDLNVVSKSGTTLEPALAFRMFRGLLDAKYGPEKAKNTSSPRRTPTAACSSTWPMKRAGRRSSSRTTSAGATACCLPSACCRWPPPASTCRP